MTLLTVRLFHFFSDNGSIDYDEFKKYIIEKDILKSLADEVCYEMQDAFNIFDKDGDGYITRSELKRVLTQVGKVTYWIFFLLVRLLFLCLLKIYEKGEVVHNYMHGRGF